MNYIYDNSIEYKRDLLIYLDSQGILNEIKSTAVNYSQNLLSFSTESTFLPPFRFVLKLDLLRMQEISCRYQLKWRARNMLERGFITT